MEDPVKELLIKINNEISDAERDCVEEIERIRQDSEERISFAYDNMQDSTRGLRKYRDHLIKQMTDLESFKSPVFIRKF